MAVKGYTLLLEAEKKTEAAAFLEEQVKKGHIGVQWKLGVIDSQQFILNLYRLEGHMTQMQAFTSKWIHKHILNQYGGVSGVLVNDSTLK